MAGAEENLYEVEQLLVQPGTYFNPQTEVVVVVDDSASIDQEVFNMEAYEGADWVRISEEIPIDEDGRDRLLEKFQTHYHPGSAGSVSETALEQGDEEMDEGEDGQDPGRVLSTTAALAPASALGDRLGALRVVLAAEQLMHVTEDLRE